MFNIYLITNKINGKEYVGMPGQGYMNRFKDHIACSRNADKYKTVLYNAIRKYGEENFSVKLLEQVDTLK